MVNYVSLSQGADQYRRSSTIAVKATASYANKEISKKNIVKSRAGRFQKSDNHTLNSCKSHRTPKNLTITREKYVTRGEDARDFSPNFDQGWEEITR